MRPLREGCRQHLLQRVLRAAVGLRWRVAPSTPSSLPQAGVPLSENSRVQYRHQHTMWVGGREGVSATPSSQPCHQHVRDSLGFCHSRVDLWKDSGRRWVVEAVWMGGGGLARSPTPMRPTPGTIVSILSFLSDSSFEPPEP